MPDEEDQNPQPGGLPPLAADPSAAPIPVMARRTYTALRLGSVAVIAILATSIILAYGPSGDCLQRSISAYYYTGVQSVFVGTLITLGFVMVVLWGKTPFEDSMLNIAGMLAPVVAFVPTGDADNCGVIDAFGNRVKNADTPDVIEARHQALLNNMKAYLIVLTIAVIVILIFGIIAHLQGRAWLTQHEVSYWGPWIMGALLVGVGWWLMDEDDHYRLFNGTHEWSATLMFVLIGFAVLGIANQKRTGTREIDQQRQPWWAVSYAIIAALMLVGAIILKFIPGSESFETHRTLWLEAWEILWLAVFWGLQTWDRRNEGAPPRTEAEAVRMGRPV